MWCVLMADAVSRISDTTNSTCKHYLDCSVYYPPLLYFYLSSLSLFLFLSLSLSYSLSLFLTLSLSLSVLLFLYFPSLHSSISCLYQIHPSIALNLTSTAHLALTIRYYALPQATPQRRQPLINITVWLSSMWLQESKK